VADSRAIAKIPTRIHVTGIRGKTTTTRLIGAALRYHGWRVVTKTTGKAARLIDPEGTERGIRGHHEQPNLREQPRIIESVADAGGADAIVFECMAIRPKNIIAESKFVRSTISVITNVRADHLDVMGPSLEDVAWNLSGIVTSNGVVVTAEKKYIPIIRKRAEEKNAKVMEVDPDIVPDENLSKFSYMIFKENIAIAIKVCELLKIPPDEALKGMLDAKPDPGLTRILNGVIANHNVRLIAAFGVNDVDSTRLVFQELSRRRVIEEQRMLVGMFHAREDRVTRTLEFAQVMAQMPFEKILVVGEMTNLFVNQATREGYAKEKIVNLGTVDPPAIMDFLSKMSLEPDQGVTLFGCGNMIGIEDFIDAFERLSEKQDSTPMESRK
jgi:poly-gamma-glutamate synthase PgsB/CapB